MAQTLLLDVGKWDLCVDAFRNIATASEPYSLAQDAASAIRTFASECWYDKSLGIPYWTQVLGFAPPLSLMKSYFVTAALTVPKVVSAQCFIASISDRKIRGQVQVIDIDGNISAASF